MTPRICPTCKGPLVSRVLRGLFVATDRPRAVYYDGQRLSLFPLAAQMLAKLAGQDFVSKAELRGTITNDRTLNVHLSAIRRALPPGVTLENDFGKGYRLVLPA